MSFDPQQQIAETAFGEVKVESMMPITQVSAQYGLLNGVLTVTDSAGAGTTTIVDNKFNCETGVTADGLASITTLRQLAYRAGQGAVARITAVFSPGVAGNVQAAGLITAENSFTFGFQNTLFGIIHAHDGQDELQELTLTVAGGAENATVTVDGTPFIVALSGLGTVQDDAFEISESLNAQVPNYQFTSNNDQVVAQSVLPGPQGAFAYSSAGTSVGSWAQLVSGVVATQDFIAQADWNQDTRISSDVNVNLDPTKGNVYQIQYQYLGFGAIRFFVEDKETGKFVLVHVIEYANDNTVPSVTNPTFRVGWLVTNLGNTSNVVVQGSSAGGFIEGQIVRDNPPRSESNDQLSIGTTLTNILSLRNRISFGDKVNRAEVFPQLISGSTQANKFALFKLLLNPTFVTPPTFEYIDKSGSIVEVTKDSVAVTGGQEIGAITIVDGSSLVLRFNENQVTPVFPGSTLCIAAEIPSGAAADCQTAATWQEDL